jgi:hypothetical protein
MGSPPLLQASFPIFYEFFVVFTLPANTTLLFFLALINIWVII